MIFETYDQSNKDTLPDQRQIQTNTKTITKHDMAVNLRASNDEFQMQHFKSENLSLDF